MLVLLCFYAVCFGAFHAFMSFSVLGLDAFRLACFYTFILLRLCLAIMRRGDMLRILKGINHGYNTVKDGCYLVLSYVMLYVNVMLWR